MFIKIPRVLEINPRYFYAKFSAHYQLRLAFHQVQKFTIQGQFFSFYVCSGMTVVYTSREQSIALFVVMPVDPAKIRTDMVDGTEVSDLERTMSLRLNITPNLNNPVV
jgi:hypothetical protein